MMPPLPPQMIRCIKMLRALGMSIDAVAEEMGCARSGVMNVSRGVRAPRKAVISREEIDRCREEAGLGSYKRNRRATDEQIDLLRREMDKNLLPLKSDENARIDELGALGLGYCIVARIVGFSPEKVRKRLCPR